MLSSPAPTISPPSKSPSGSPSHDNRLGGYASVSSAVTSSDSSPVIEPPVPIPPPEPPSKPGSAPRTEVRDPFSGSDGGVTSSVEDVSRQAKRLQELSRKVINMAELRQLASQGIPDGAGIRSTVWKA